MSVCSRYELTTFETIYVKGENGLEDAISTQNDPSVGKPSDLPEATVEVKTEFVPEEDETDCSDMKDHWFQFAEDQVSEIKTEVDVGLDDITSTLHSMYKCCTVDPNVIIKEETDKRALVNYPTVAQEDSDSKNNFPQCSILCKDENMSSESQSVVSSFTNAVFPVSCKSSAHSLNEQQQCKTYYDYDRIKLADVSVVFEDLFQKRPAKERLNSKSCSCISCTGKFKLQSKIGNYQLEHHLRESSKEELTVEHNAICFIECDESSCLPDRTFVLSTEKQVLCAHCTTRFETKADLDQHLVLKMCEENATRKKNRQVGQSEERPFSCHLCPAKFKTKYASNYHQYAHKNEKPYSCTQCGASFKTKRTLKSHLVVHSLERPFLCDKCPATFKSKGLLKRHVATHLIERPLKTFSCDRCSASFKSKQGLESHLASYSKVRPFSCTECRATFKTKHQERSHFMYAHIKRPFICINCKASWRTIRGLQSHLLKYGSREPSLALNPWALIGFCLKRSYRLEMVNETQIIRPFYLKKTFTDKEPFS